ncbi:MAG: M23 family metallopeptidase [Treponema sp.]|nr:M23 family metallopeptidase [Treponema sp.]
MTQFESDFTFSEFTAPVRKGRNNRHYAGCDEGKYGSIEKRSTLNSINMMGYTKNETAIKASKDVWDEKVKVEYGDTGSDFGNYTIGDDKIRLSTALLGGGREGSAKLAAVMSHESTHYYGERREAMAHLNGLDTYSQINKLFKLKGDSTLSNEMLAGVLNAENWKENSGDVDHWTMMKDGSLKKDNDGWLRDEDGMYINSDGSRTTWRTEKTLGAKGIETGLLNILYPDEGSGYGKKYADFTSEQKDEAQKLMHDSGMKMEDGDKYTANWINDNENHIIKTGKYMDIAGDTVATPVFMQAMDGKSDSIIFGNFLDKTLANLSMIGKDYAGRFNEFVDAKREFINNRSDVITPDANTVWKQGFGPSNILDNNGNIIYKDGIHKGGDIAALEGTPVYNEFGGRVVFEKFNTTSSGYSVALEYGFEFQNSFYSMGLASQYMHFNSESPIAAGSYVTAGTQIGNVGHTGAVSGNPGNHLHYQLMGLNYNGIQNYTEPEAYKKRRELLLQYIGSNNRYYSEKYNNYYYSVDYLSGRY